MSSFIIPTIPDYVKQNFVKNGPHSLFAINARERKALDLPSAIRLFDELWPEAILPHLREGIAIDAGQAWKLLDTQPSQQGQVKNAEGRRHLLATFGKTKVIFQIKADEKAEFCWVVLASNPSAGIWVAFNDKAQEEHYKLLASRLGMKLDFLLRKLLQDLESTLSTLLTVEGADDDADDDADAS